MGINSFLNAIDEEKRQADSFRTNMTEAYDYNPDDEAEKRRLQQQTGIPATLMDDDLKKQAKRQTFMEKLNGLDESNPSTTGFLSDPVNARVAHDDVDNLARLESLFQKPGTVYNPMSIASPNDQKTAKRAKSVGGAFLEGIESSPDRTMAGFAEKGVMLADFVDWSLAAFPDETGMRKRVADAARESQAYWTRRADAIAPKKKAGSAESYFQQAGTSIGTSLLAAPFGIAGEGAALGMFGLSSEGGYQDMKDAGVSMPVAGLLSASNSAMEGLTEKIGMDRLYKGNGPVLKKAIEFVLGDLGGEEINTLYNALVDKVTIRPDMTMGDVVQQVIDTAIVTSIAGPAQGVAMHGAAKGSETLYEGYQQKLRADQRRDFFLALGEGAQASKLRERLPEKFREFIAQSKENGGLENVYIPAEHWATFWQEQGQNPEEMAQEVGTSSQEFMEALATGGDLVIPFEDYATHLAPTEYHQALVKDIRLNPGDMTERELEAWTGKMPEHLKTVAAETGNGEDSSGKVYDAVLGELLGVGTDKSTAELQALLWQENMKAWGARLGRDAWSMYQENPLRVRRPMPEFMTRRDFVDTSIDPFLDRLRTGDIPTDTEAFGTSLVEFLREKGLQDEGGELSAMGANEGAKPFQKKLAREDGLSLDKAREAAVAAGYLPEGADISAFLNEIDKELRGNPVYSMQHQTGGAADLRGELENLQRFLESRGIDVAAMSNEEIRAALKGMEGASFNQSPQSRQGSETLSVRKTQAEGMLLTAVLKDGEVKVAGVGATHYDVHSTLKAEIPEGLTDANGFVTPDNKFLDRKQSLAWVKENRPDVFKALDKTTVKNGLESQAYAHAEGMGGDTASVADDFIKRQFGGGMMFFGQSFAEGKRGSITFAPGFRDIALLEKADLSTFLHESGHAWLEDLKRFGQMEGAPDDVRQDWETIAAWGGFAPDVSSIPVEAHEKFARAVEAYLMEGNAPSVELQPAFQRFKAWLIRIYRSIKGLNVELTDEVRGVMDRILATDEEIARAKEAQSFHPLFTDAASAGMTEREFAAYRKEVEKAHNEAETRLQQKLMKELTREQEAWWKDERAKVRGEVEAEAQEVPVYQAMQVLTNGVDFEGNAAPEGFKLSKNDLVRMYGKEFVKRLPRSFHFLYSKEGGLHPDEVAEVFGFSSGDEMVRTMANTPPLKKYVEAETDIRMRSVYGDMLNDGTIADEALKALHSDYQGQVLRAELRALRRKQREVSPYVKAEKAKGEDAVAREKREREYERRWMEAEKKLALEMERGAKEEELRKIREEIRANKEAQRRERQAMEAGIPPLDAFKLWAVQAIGSKELRDIRPVVYARAEQKAGKAAFDAAAKGKYDLAGEEKQKQLLNHYLYLEAVKAKEDEEKIVEYARRLEKPAAQQRIGKAGGDYLDQINAILERYEFKRQSLETLSKRQDLREWAQQQAELGLEPSIPEEILVDAGKRNYKELSIDELRAVRDALKNIEHLSKEANRIRIEGEEIELEAAIGELSTFVTENFDPKRIPIDKETRSWLEKQGETLSRFDASLIKAEQLIEWMDGGKINGPWARMIFRPIAAAEAREYDLTLQYTKRLADLFEAYGKEKQSAMMEKVFIRSLGESLTRQAAIAAALNTGNESNRTKLLEGYAWSDENLDEILSHLDGHDWDFVQQVWDMIDELWPEIADLEKRLTGVAPPKVEAREFTNAHGTFRGGYYPVVYDPLHSAAGEKQTDAKGDRLFESTYVRATTQKGHTKSRIEAAAYPIHLSLEVIPQHMAQVIHDLTHREAVVTANRLLTNKDLRPILNSTIGAPYYKMLKQWLATVANDRNIDKTGNEFWTRFMGTLRTNATIVGMGFRATTMFAQIAGLSQSLDMVKGKYLGTALTRFMRHPFEAMAWVAEKSGEMKHRRNSLDRDIRDGVRKLMGKHGAKQWVQAKAFMGVALFDAAVSVPTWMGAYEQAKAENLSEGDAIAAADRAVRLSQGSGGAKDLAAVQRSNDMMKLFTMFYSYFSVLYNRLRNMGRLKGTSELGWSDVAWKSFVMVMVPAIMGELLAGRGPGDDDDEAAWALRKILVYPFLTIPFLRDIMNSFDSGRPYTLTPMSRLFEMTAKLPKQVEAVAENRKELSDLLLQNMDIVGYSAGLPTGQVRTTTKYIWDLTDGEVQPEDMGDVLKGLVFGHKKEGKK